MDSTFLQFLKKYYWAVFLGNILVLLGLLSSYWSLPPTLVRAYPVVFVTVSLVLGAGMGSIIGLAHAQAQTLVNTPRERLRLALYGSIALGMLCVLLLMVTTMGAIIDLQIVKKLTGRYAAESMGNLYFYAWLTSAFLMHGLTGLRGSGLGIERRK